MNKNLEITILLLFCSLARGCNKDISVFRVRGSITSSEGKKANVKVIAENEFGDCMTGAVVLVTDSSNTVTVLEYDSDLCCYSSDVAGVENEIYTIHVDSIAAGKIHTLKIPHTRLLEKPALISFSDSKGNSVLSGDKLSLHSSFYAAWNSCGNDIVYNVTIKTPVSTVWSSSSSSTNIEIPSDNFKAGVYYIYITAQKIYGDPYFLSENYYSVSSMQSSGIQFYVE